MKREWLLRSLAILGSTVGVIMGCSGGSPEGELPASKPITSSEAEEGQKKLEQMKGAGYKGAPGVPYRPASK